MLWTMKMDYERYSYISTEYTGIEKLASRFYQIITEPEPHDFSCFRV
jgi:hypothetical protein